MDTNQSGNDATEGGRRLRFGEQASRELQKGFLKALPGRGDDRPIEMEFQARVFVGTLEGYAEAIPEFERFNPPEQKRRREKVSSFAAALEKLHQVLGELDSAALGFAVWRGLKECESKSLGESPLEPGMPAVFESAAMRKDILPTLAAFSTGVRKAIKELPKHDFNFMLKTALAVERSFWEYNLPFSVSNSGFAARCLREVFLLGGLRDARVDYWLTLARDSEESMTVLMKRLQGSQKSAED